MWAWLTKIEGWAHYKFMMGCFESRRGRKEAGAAGESHQGEQFHQSEIKTNDLLHLQYETVVSYHPEPDKKLTLSMVSNKDKRYWDYDFKGT